MVVMLFAQTCESRPPVTLSPRPLWSRINLTSKTYSTETKRQTKKLDTHIHCVILTGGHFYLIPPNFLSSHLLITTVFLSPISPIYSPGAMNCGIWNCEHCCLVSPMLLILLLRLLVLLVCADWNEIKWEKHEIYGKLSKYLQLSVIFSVSIYPSLLISIQNKH